MDGVERRDAIVTSQMDARHTHRARAEQSAIDGLVERLMAQFPELSREDIVSRVQGAVVGFERDQAATRTSRSVFAHQTRSSNMASTDGLIAAAMSLIGALPPKGWTLNRSLPPM
jgi:hypothetical protein